jgi:GTP-binding protein EngB required for normal cell division
MSERWQEQCRTIPKTKASVRPYVVGKSSLLNLVTLGASDALVSAMPGTTQRINHYLVDHKWWIVDLPGYGYAQATVGSGMVQVETQ